MHDRNRSATPTVLRGQIPGQSSQRQGHGTGPCGVPTSTPAAPSTDRRSSRDLGCTPKVCQQQPPPPHTALGASLKSTRHTYPPKILVHHQQGTVTAGCRASPRPRPITVPQTPPKIEPPPCSPAANGMYLSPNVRTPILVGRRGTRARSLDSSPACSGTASCCGERRWSVTRRASWSERDGVGTPGLVASPAKPVAKSSPVFPYLGFGVPRTSLAWELFIPPTSKPPGPLLRSLLAETRMGSSVVIINVEHKGDVGA